MSYFKFYKSGSLALVTGIGVVIALLLSGLLLLLSYQNLYEKKNDRFNALTRVLHTSIAEVKSGSNMYDTIVQTANLGPNSYVKIATDKWGLWNKHYAEISDGRMEIKKMGLMGYAKAEVKNSSIHLKSNNPIVLVGKSHITGSVFPKTMRIKSGSIAGISHYAHDKSYITTQGEPLNPSVLNLKEIHASLQDLLRNSISISDTNLSDDIQNSFFNLPKLLFSRFPITLKNIQVQGNIIIQSDQSITIDHSAVLTDVIIVAPSVQINEGVQGQFQVFGTQSIEVAENCLLRYPSALVLLESTPLSSNGQIVIRENSVLEGALVYHNEAFNESDHFEENIALHANSQISGDIYCDGNTMLAGSFTGDLYTNRFIIRKNGRVYLNHILDGTVIINDYIPLFSGIPRVNQKTDLIQWLY